MGGTPPHSPPRQSPGCVVIVDDVPDNLQLLTRTLRQHGYQVRAAATALMGLATIQAEPPDLVLLDLMLPDLDGWEVCRRLKESPETADIPIIFLTARNQTRDVVRAFQVGGVDYVSKPFQVEELLARIRTHIRLRRAECERARMERRLHETQKLESLVSLASGVAHDFNNLLTVILGNAELVRMELPLGSPVQDLLKQVESAGQRAAELCRQMLAYSGRSRFRVETLDLNVLVREQADLLRHVLPARGVLGLNLAPSLPPFQGESSQVRQVVTSLVHNACEALPDGIGSVTVSTTLCQASKDMLAAGYLAPDLPAGDYLCLEVRDDGCGMPAETLTRVFDPFFTTKFVGRGLGLAAVLGIVRGHKGSIQAQSAPGQGTCFRVLLPASPIPAALVRPPLPDKETGRQGDKETEVAVSLSPCLLVSLSGSGVPGSILVVDDEEEVRHLTGLLLEQAGYAVLRAAGGREALAYLSRSASAIRLVLLDLTMPEMDGAETFQAIHQAYPELPVILMSGYTEQEATVLFATGLAGFLQKPFQSPTLLAKVRQTLPQV